MIEVQDKCMDEYKKIMAECPVLSPEKERELIEVINKYKGGKTKQQASETLFNSNIRLVLKEASRFKTILPLADLMGAGCYGLWIAVERFDPKHKVKFSTYAIPWIKLMLYRIIKTDSIVYIPSNVRDKAQKYKTLMEDGKPISDEELRYELDVSQKGLEKIRLAQHKVLSLDYVYSNNSDEDDSVTLGDFIPDSKALNPSVETQRNDRLQVIHEVLNELEPIQKEIIMARYLNGGEKVNLSALGKKYKITGERVRQIEFKALKRLRKRITNKTNFQLG